jgi:hypothetical protein
MADGDNLRIGRGNAASSETRLTRSGAGLPDRTNWAFTLTNQNGSGIRSRALGVPPENVSHSGIMGYSDYGLGVVGHSDRDAGVFAQSESTEGPALVVNSLRSDGVSCNAAGNGLRVVARDGDGIEVNAGGDTGVYAEALASNSTGVYGRGQGWGGRFEGSVGVYGSSAGGRAGLFGGRVQVFGDFEVVAGIKAAVVEHPDGSHRRMYSLESPESYFEDVGRAQMSGGQTRVALDAEFTALIDTDDYHVFLTPEGDSQGLYISNRSPSGFEVHEQGGGTSDLPFSYRVVAKRKDVQPRAERLQRVEVSPPPAPEAPPPIPEAPPERRRRLEQLRAEAREAPSS